MLRRLTLLLKSSMIAYLGLTSIEFPPENTHASLPRKRAMNRPARAEPQSNGRRVEASRPRAPVIIVAAELLLLPGRLFVECHLTAAVRSPYGENEKQRRQW